MSSSAKQSDGEIRASLIAAARTLAARDGKFSLQHLYAECGVSKADFYRCFANKEALLAAIVSGDVAVLNDMVQSAKPLAVEQRVAQAGGGGVVVTPPVDAWLERRLRVFERALSALESRQEKSERDLARSIGLLEEKFAATPVHALAPRPELSLIDRAAAQFSHAPEEVMFAPVAPAAPAPAAAAPLAEPAIDESPSIETPVLAELAAEAPANEFVADDSSTIESQIVDEDPVSGPEIEDFIAHARNAANRAAQQKAEPARSLSLPRWIAWMGVAAVALVVCVGVVLGNVARATQSGSAAAIAYRAQPHDAMGRMMALADSGDARAQTLLALAYLRGQLTAPNNDEAARRWGLAAAQQGEPMAQYMVGTLYSKQDAAKAFSWFEQAALRGNIKAMHNLAIAYAQGQGTAEDDRRAAAWFNRAANQGYVDSQFDLAVLFERGQGVTQNRVAALKWYQIAARGGDGPSKSRAEQLRAEMPPEEIARAQQLVAAWKPQPRDPAANAVLSP